MTIRLIEKPDELFALREAWDSLLERSPAANPFLTFEWISSWWGSFGAGRRLFILAAFDETGARLKGVAPFMVSRRAMFRVIEFIGTGLADRLNFLVEAGSGGLVDEFFSFLTARKRAWDLLSFRDVPEDDPDIARLPGIARRWGCRVIRQRMTVAPYLPIRCGWEECLAGRSGHFRKILRQKENRISREGADFQVRRIRNSFDVELQGYFSEILRKSWKGRELGSIEQTERHEVFYFDLFRGFAKKGWLDLWLATISGRPAAYLIHFNFKDAIFFYNSAFAGEFRGLAPGAVLTARAIEDAFRQGRTECDFLRGQEEFKSHWTSERRILRDLVIVRSGIRSRAAQLALMTIGGNVRRGLNHLAWIRTKRASRSGRPANNG